MKTIRLLYLQIYVNIIGLPVYCEINKIVKTFTSQSRFHKTKENISVSYQHLIH